jgi:hypothetical protein
MFIVKVLKQCKAPRQICGTRRRVTELASKIVVPRVMVVVRPEDRESESWARSKGAGGDASIVPTTELRNLHSSVDVMQPSRSYASVQTYCASNWLSNYGSFSHGPI